MATFQASIYNSGILAVSVSGTNLTVTDYSNYDTNTQFAQTEFTDYRKIKILQPDGTEYLFSSISDGDVSCIVPNGATLPITDQYAYTSGDGVYEFTLYALPTWSASVSYLLSTGDHVYRSGKMYKALQNSTNKDPLTQPTYWEEVTDEDNLGGNYISTGRTAIVCDLQKCYITLTHSAAAAQNCYSCNNTKLCNIKEWKNAVQLLMYLEAIQGEVDRQAWNNVTNLINAGRQICCCS